MVLSCCRTATGAVAMFAIAFSAGPAFAGARELATAQGTIGISEARPGLRAPSCSELVVEARDALDNHLIAETQPTADENGACRYMLSVPAQTAVWLRVQPVLVAGARVANGANANATSGSLRRPAGSVALRFTIIAPTTYFFAPSELKTIQLSY
jgi:hypothetical protein